jgi:hypothetical protein
MSLDPPFLPQRYLLSLRIYLDKRGDLVKVAHGREGAGAVAVDQRIFGYEREPSRGCQGCLGPPPRHRYTRYIQRSCPAAPWWDVEKGAESRWHKRCSRRNSFGYDALL